MLGYVLSVWAVAAVGGYLPYVVGLLGQTGGGHGEATGSPWLSVLNVLSGGVFVAAGFMHLLPEAEEGLQRLSAEYQFQFAPFFASLAFILMFLLEELVAHASSSFNPYSCTPGFDNESHFHQARLHELSSPCALSGNKELNRDHHHHHLHHHVFPPSSNNSESGFPSPTHERIKMEDGSLAVLPRPTPTTALTPEAGLIPGSASGGSGSISVDGRGSPLPRGHEFLRQQQQQQQQQQRRQHGGASALPDFARSGGGFSRGSGGVGGRGVGGRGVGSSSGGSGPVGRVSDLGNLGGVFPGNGSGGGDGDTSSGEGVDGGAVAAIYALNGSIDVSSSNSSGGGFQSKVGASLVPDGRGGRMGSGVGVGSWIGRWNADRAAGEDVHLTGLKGDGGGAGNGVKRLGTKGTYGAVASHPQSSPTTLLEDDYCCWPKDLGAGVESGRVDVERGIHLDSEDRQLLASESDDLASPPRTGDGPWIGRRLLASEKLQLLQHQHSPRSLSAAVAGALGSVGGGDGGGGARGGGGRGGEGLGVGGRGSKLRVRCYDENDSLDGGGGHSELRLFHLDKTSGQDGRNCYSGNLGMILGAVLSVHAVMEGLGLGASSATAAPGIFAAIVVHKGLAAFSLGCIFFSSESSRLQYFLFMGVFSLLTPLGAAMGMVVRAGAGGSSAGAGVCTALGAGTFLHVAAMEVLPRDLLHDTRMKKTKMACLVGGYLTFAGLSRYV